MSDYQKQRKKWILIMSKDEGIKKDVDVVMTNSLGFGGHNATLIVRKYS